MDENQLNWPQFLQIVEYSYNNSINDIICTTSFISFIGYNLEFHHHIENDIYTGEILAMEDRLGKLEKVHDQLKKH